MIPETGQAPTPTAQAADGTQPDATQAGNAATPVRTMEEIVAENARLQAELAKTNRESAGYRVKARELDEIKTAQLSEIDQVKLQATQAAERYEQTQAALRQERMERAVEREAGKLRFYDPEDALALIQGKITFDDEGRPQNIGELLNSLAVAKPHLINRTLAGVPAATGNPGRTEHPHNGTIRRAEIGALYKTPEGKNRVLEAMVQGRIVD